MPRLLKENGWPCGRRGATRLLAPSRSLIVTSSTSPRARTLTSIIACQNLSHFGKQYICSIRFQKHSFYFSSFPKSVGLQGDFTKHKADAPFMEKRYSYPFLHICMYLDPHRLSPHMIYMDIYRVIQKIEKFRNCFFMYTYMYIYI